MATNVFFQLDGEGPLYRQLYRSIRGAVLAGRVTGGTRLPATRLLAEELSLSRTTVMLAFDQLRAEGYIEGRRRAGTFVRRSLPEELLLTCRNPDRRDEPDIPTNFKLPRNTRRFQKIGADHEQRYTRGSVRIDFRLGDLNPNDFPTRIWKQLKRRFGERDKFGYSNPAGETELREAVASYLERARGLCCNKDHIIITNGAQQAISLLASVLVERGDRCVIEEPHYHGAKDAFETRGARLIGVPADAHGLQVDRLPKTHAVRAAYVTPSHQFPLGGVLPLERRLALLSWARENRTLLIEDDYDGEFQYGVRPIEALHSLDKHEVVMYVGSFSKTLSPGFRIGYAVPPRNLYQALLGAKAVADQFTQIAHQQLLAAFVAEGHYDAHLRRMRIRHKRRRGVLLESLKTCVDQGIEVHGSDAGLNLALGIPGLPASATSTLIGQTRRRGVGIYSMETYFLRPPKHVMLQLGYAALTPAQIQRGIAIFADVLKDLHP